MEYVYAALLIDAAGKEVNEQSVMEVVKAAGFAPDEAQAKALVSSLKGVNIKDVIKNAQAAQMQTVAAPQAQAAAPKKEEKKEEKKSEEEAAGGLAGLFG